jgi:hypothetical protein
MPMMGSRGESPPSLAALSLLGELVALLKQGVDGTLGQRLEELKTAEEHHAAAQARLAEADQMHAARAEELDQRIRAASEHEAELVRRETACREGVEKTGQMQATFDRQSAELAVREGLLARKVEEHAQVAKAFTEECAVTRAALATEQREQLEALAKDRQQLQTDAALSREAQQADAARIIAKAKEDAGRVHTELTAREAVITARETAFKQRTAELRAALPE